MKHSFNQKSRFIFFLIYIALLFPLSKLIIGSWLLPTNDQSLWFYSGLAALLLSSLLETPFFVTPKDAISYGVAAILAIIAVSAWPQGVNQTLVQISKWSTIIFSSISLLSGISAILLLSSKNSFLKKIANLTKFIASNIGNPKFLYSLVFIFSISILTLSSEKKLVLAIAWFIIIAVQPIERIAYLVTKFYEVFRGRDNSEDAGEIIGYQTPNLFIFSQNENIDISTGTLLISKTEKNEPGIGLVIDHIGYVDARWVRAIAFKPARKFHKTISKYLISKHVIKPDLSIISDITDYHRDQINNIREKMIGLVTRDSNIHTLKIDITRSDIEIQEGRLVETIILGKRIIYQIINGLTQEEILHQKNTHGFVCAEAKKIGYWDDEKGGFQAVKWLPQPNTPVFIIDEKQGSINQNAIGYFPRTDYPVGISNINELVTHNTAILGILGIGKTFLSLELIERMTGEGIKVICLDLTNQYEKHLSDFLDASMLAQNTTELRKVGKEGKNNVRRNVHEGGSINEFRALLKKKLEDFLEGNQKMLQIYNPSEFLIWRQDSRPYQGQASMAVLTPPQITQIFTEIVLEIMQSHGMSDKAKCCLIFEEAHSLIPEWNSIVDEGDKNATNGTARAILQGRKFGLGCIVITQRTANVTKSILNQCNSIFALRVFDETGMKFLKNYIGPDYSNVLSHLDERHAIFFGKASTCQEPVLVRLNDREDFIKAFRPIQEQEDDIPF
jgi:hypothetical protein